MWPNLGVNCAAGSVVGVAGAQAHFRAMYGADYYIPCQVCNVDEHKPHPQQDKIDMAREIHKRAASSRLAAGGFPIVVEFDGSCIVNRWNRSERYLVQRPLKKKKDGK